MNSTGRNMKMILFGFLPQFLVPTRNFFISLKIKETERRNDEKSMTCTTEGAPVWILKVRI